jgi:hypothetical protein
MATRRDEQPAAPPGRVLEFVSRKTATRHIPDPDPDWDIDLLTLLNFAIELAMLGMNQEEMYQRALEDIETAGTKTEKGTSPTGNATPTLEYWRHTLNIRRINLESLSRASTLLNNPPVDFHERLREIREDAAKRQQQIRDSICGPSN